MRSTMIIGGALLSGLAWAVALAAPAARPARLAGATLSSFEVSRPPAGVLLRWGTSSEQNTLRFEVERSTDGRTFSPVGRVRAAANSQTFRAYTFTDLGAQPLRRVRSYYRLALVDADSSRSFSPLRPVEAVPEPVVLRRPSLYPNPCSGTGTLGIVEAPPEVPVRVIDRLGRVHATGATDGEGRTEVALPPGLPAGVYVVHCGPRYAHLMVLK